MRIAGIEIPPDWAAQIEEIAQTKSTTPREVVRAALTQYLDKIDPITGQLVNANTAYYRQGIADLYSEVNNWVNNLHSHFTPASEYIQQLLQVLNLYAQYYSPSVPEIQQYAEEIDFEFILEDVAKILSSMKIGAEHINENVQMLSNSSCLDKGQVEVVREALAQYLDKVDSLTGHLVQAETLRRQELIGNYYNKIHGTLGLIYGNLPYVSNVSELLQLLHLYAQYYPLPVPEIQPYAEAINLKFLAEDLPKVLSSIKIGAERIRQLSYGLRAFFQFGQTNAVHESLDFILLILEPQVKPTADRAGIQVIKEYGSVPQLKGNSTPLNSVLMNVLTLAINALEESIEPTLRICTQVDDKNKVVIRIGDNLIELSIDSEHRLHAEAEPAIKWGNGCGLYSYHGVTLPEKYGKLPPDQWQAQWLLSEDNAERRRVLIQGIGYTKICTELQATELDAWAEYTLLEIDQVIDMDGESIYLLKMTCPSTGFIHALRVPPNMRSAHEAICWVNWGVDPLEFSVQT